MYLARVFKTPGKAKEAGLKMTNNARGRRYYQTVRFLDGVVDDTPINLATMSEAPIDSAQASRYTWRLNSIKYAK